MRFENVSNSAIESVDIDKAYEKALKFFDEVSPRVNPNDEEFIERYGRTEVEKDRMEIADKYDKTLKIISRIISEKMDISSEGIERDRVFSSIRDNMEIFKD